MVKTVKKRDGREKEFDFNRIMTAVKSAYKEVYDDDYEKVYEKDIACLVPMIETDMQLMDKVVDVETIQDIVVEDLELVNRDVAIAYEDYRKKRAEARIKNDKKEKFYKEILECTNVDNDNANVDQYSFSGRKYRITDLEQKQYALRNLISKEGKEAFEEGLIYYHDLASYAIGEHNCTNLMVEKGFENGFNTRNGGVRPSNSFSTACQLLAVMFQLQSQTQYGGVGASCLDFQMAKEVKKSFKKHFIDGLIEKEDMTEEAAKNTVGNDLLSIDSDVYKNISEKALDYANRHMEKEGQQACEALYHNLNTLESRAGSQLPFTSINLGRDISPEGRLINKWIFNASINGIGKNHRTSIFPISIFMYKKGVNDKEGTPNYDIKKLAIKSLTKRIYPNIVNGDYKQVVEDPNDYNTFFATMGCRTMMGYDRFTGKYTINGRGNLSPITIILPKIGLDYGVALGKRDKADVDGFFNKLNETLDLVAKELVARAKYIMSQSPKSASFIYENNLVLDAEKSKGKKDVKETMKHGSNAIGILGMAECCMAMFGKHHGESIEAYKFALKICKLIKQKCSEYSDKYDMNFGEYFTPAENLCKTACDTLKLYYGEVKGVLDRKYLTNSIHIPVWYQLDAYSKLVLEAPFTQYGTAGCITYVELDNNSVNNPEGIERLIDFAMDLNIPYLAINFPINTCLDCGSTYNVNEERCPNCGSNNVEMLKRVTGYITGNYKTAFNEGKQQEAEQRVTHTIFNPSCIPVLKQAYKELEEMGIIRFNEVQ